MSNPETRINIRVTYAFKERVNKYIEENNISLTDFVTQSLEKAMNERHEENDLSTLKAFVKTLARNVETNTNTIDKLQVKSPA